MAYRKVEVIPSITFKIGFVQPVGLEVQQSAHMFVDAANEATQLLREYLEDTLDFNVLTLEFIENNEADIELMDADIDEDEFYTVDGDDIQY